MHKEYAILSDDRAWLEHRIIELEKIIQDLGPEFYDIFNQSPIAVAVLRQKVGAKTVFGTINTIE